MKSIKEIYVKELKLDGIVTIAIESHEKGNYLDTYTTEEIACRAEDGKYHRMTINFIHKTVENKYDYNPKEDVIISEEEYEKICEQYGDVFNAAEYRKKLEKRSMVEEQLRKMEPVCPQCQISMKQRSGPYGDFWGCSNYPKCKKIKKISPIDKIKIEDLKKELGTLI